MEDQFSKYSDAEAHRVARLIAGFIKGTLSNNERDELDEWICASEENMQLFEKLTDEKNIESAMKWMESIETEKALEKIKERVEFKKPKAKTIRLKWTHYVAAASIILIAGFIIFKVLNKKDDPGGIVKNTDTDILPGTNKSTLTMENGKTIVLDNGSTDTTINGQIKVLRQQGEIVYTDQSTNIPMNYHTLTVPRKGHYKLVLPDGTKVWMNAESSIRYPIAFPENERKVFVTGEAYFEVATSLTSPGAGGATPSRGGQKIPFRVVVNDIMVEALGTAFNINSYSNEPFFSATLVEGSVLVSNGKTENMLKPGQQARITASEFTIAEVETNNIVAWKDNLFRFTNAPLDEIMRQAERWYDAEVVYESKPTDHFNLTDVSRNVPLSKLLRALELTNRVHFKIEGKKVIVMK